MVNRHFQIVIADDDRDEHFFLEEAIKITEISYNLKSFYNGSSILDYLQPGQPEGRVRKFLPDVIILDINMPYYNGIEVLTVLKADAILQKIPVYILSTTNQDATKKKCLSLGASEFYTKPSDIKELNAIIGEIFATVI